MNFHFNEISSYMFLVKKVKEEIGEASEID